MKKFLATVLALATLGGAGLFFGWAQRGVPPDSYGVLRSRSHGTDPSLITPGEFRWVWYKLIPTNAQVSAFRLRPVQRQFSARGALPSAGVYSGFMRANAAFLGMTGVAEDFSWEISAAMSFRLRPGALIPLVESRGIGSQEELDGHTAALADEMAAFIIRWAQDSDDFAWNAGTLLLDGDLPALAREIERRFPETADFSLRVTSARLPDFGLYDHVRGLYRDFMARWEEAIADDLPDLAARRRDNLARNEELEMRGALLTRFPILLEYLRIEGGGATSPQGPTTGAFPLGPAGE